MPVIERSGLQRGVVALALSLLMVCIWSLTHRYHGLTGDAELYAVQALAKIHPALTHDVYLQNVSQDRYTVFPQLNAQLIRLVGLREAACGLFVLFTAWFLAASWALVRRLADTTAAWLAVTLLVVTVGRYGPYGVFHFGEEFLTARSCTEALEITALVAFYAGRRMLGLVIAAAMLFIHPLMALPGLLLVICLWVGPRVSVAAALAGIGATALIARAALVAPHADGQLALIAGDWLDVVTERSQFLFLQLWRPHDWKNNALPFASLLLTLLVVREPRVRQLAWAAMLVGASGLAVAWIAGSVGPVAILLQGQAWRWVWITSYASIVLLAPTLLWMWRDERCGPLCATALLGAWTCAAVDTWTGIGIATVLWLARPWISIRVAVLLRWAALGIAVILAVWTVATAWTIVSSALPESGREPAAIAFARNLMGLQTTTLSLFGLAFWWLATRRSAWAPGIACLALGGVAAATMPGALKQFPTAGTRAEVTAFADWREAIPPSDNVMVFAADRTADFVWFTLQRPEYLSVDQSAGVVFSRTTALEIKRRSDALKPFVPEDWKIRTFLETDAHRKSAPAAQPQPRPLTAAALATVCRDPELGFVIARENVGFDPLQHTRPGPYRDWYLYDCRHVRSAGARA